MRGHLRAFTVRRFWTGSPTIFRRVGFYLAYDRSLRRSNLSLLLVSTHEFSPSSWFGFYLRVNKSKAFFDDADAHFVLNCTIPPAVNNGAIMRSGIISYIFFGNVDSSRSPR